MGGADDGLVAHGGGGLSGIDLAAAVKQSEIVLHAEDARDGLVELLFGDVALFDKPLEFAKALIAEFVFGLVENQVAAGLEGQRAGFSDAVFFHRAPIVMLSWYTPSKPSLSRRRP